MATARLTLNHDDLMFLSESIGQNVPCSEDRTDKENATTDKINNALMRVMEKERNARS